MVCEYYKGVNESYFLPHDSQVVFAAEVCGNGRVGSMRHMLNITLLLCTDANPAQCAWV